MTALTSQEIRKRFLEFFQKRGHVVIPSASLIPENDPSVLFNTAGMQPLVPYLLGKEHPAGKRLVNIQKCVRTQDIDEVGDNTHDTFFEMMGNWSLGDYWKEEAIQWSFELLTNSDDKEDGDKGFGLDPKRLYVTVFGGNDDAPEDIESFDIWKKYLPENRIYFLKHNGDKEPNWWEVGDNGPCGPDTEMFYDLTEDGLGDMTKEQYLKADDEQKVVEIWNDVFMEYLKKDGKVVGKLEKRNVDTGSGLERIAMTVQKKNNIFDTDLFSKTMEVFRTSPNVTVKDEKAFRIISDHLRTSCFLIADGIRPSNSDRGYILRRLIRRMVRYMDQVLKLENGTIKALVSASLDSYIKSGMYDEVILRAGEIANVIGDEEAKFRKTLNQGMKQLENIAHKIEGGVFTEGISRNRLDGLTAFNLYQTYGFPIELTLEICKEKNIEVDLDNFNIRLKQHQELSRAGAEQKFKGGLAGVGGKEGEVETKYHTATHLLHQALRDILGDSVEQKGSNITAERLRFDFSFDRKMTDDEKTRVEQLINEKIQLKLPMKKVTLSKTEAEKLGALHFFGDKYGEMVDVYYLGDSLDSAYSKEFCGGPHVGNTSELGTFKIIKEEAVSAGVRRIKAVLT